MTSRLPFLTIAVTWLALSGSARAQQPALPPARAGSPVEHLVPETNPAVLAALELPRTEPQHYLSAVLALADLGRPELAAPILKELAELKLNDNQRAALVDEFGSARMLQLARTTALAPMAKEFAESCLAAAAAQARDPQRIAKLIDDLSAPSASVRNAARFDLASTGEPGAVAALEALARETDPERRQTIAAAVTSMDPSAVGPLLGTLIQQRNANEFGADVIRILQAMQVTQAMPLVAGYTGSPDAERRLIDALDRYRRGTRAFVADDNGEVALWLWCEGHLEVHRYPADEAQTMWMARLALELANLRPDVRDYQLQALLLAFDAGLWVRNLDGTSGVCDLASIDAQKAVETADSMLLSDVLAEAMKQNRVTAAQKAAQLLRQRGDAGVLVAVSPMPAPLADALKYPDRRVRFAALRAIMALDPKTPFPGASRVPETLGYFATGASERRVVVAMPVADQAATLAGRLATVGIDAEPAGRGGSAVALAQQSADLEMVLVDMDIDGPGIRDVLYALRTNPASGQVPIGLLATGDRLDAAHRLASEHRRVVAFPRPQSDAALAELVARLSKVSGRDLPSPQDRAAMAGQALQWLGQLLARDHTFYDLHRQAPVVEAALYLPATTAGAVEALALLGTPSSQRSLVDFASHLSVPVAARAQAARAFAQSVQQHGLLLTEAEILRQYDRYNASQSLDADTQKVFGSLLDSIESLRAQQDADREGEVPAEPKPAPKQAQRELRPLAE